MKTEQLLTELVKEKYIAKQIVEMKEQLETRDKMNKCLKEINDNFIIIKTKSFNNKNIKLKYYKGFNRYYTSIKLYYNEYNYINISFGNIENYSYEKILCYCLMRFQTFLLTNIINDYIENNDNDYNNLRYDIDKTFVSLCKSKNIQMFDLMMINNIRTSNLDEIEWSDTDEESDED